jgi:ferrous iron transport protein B
MSGTAALTLDETPGRAPALDAPVVALIGNPNSGKTTLFNVLTGSRARVGNYPGITVEHREATISLGDGGDVRFLDLPGAYSLVPRAEDEAVALNGVLGRLPGTARPSLTVAVVDAMNLERNLYLVEVLREIGQPMIVVLTMMDAVEADGISIDADRLSRRLGVPVVPVAAPRGQGMDVLRSTIRAALEGRVAPPPLAPPVASRADLDELGRQVAIDLDLPADPAALGIWALSLQAGNAMGHVGFGQATRDLLARVTDAPVLVQQVVAARYARVSQWTSQVLAETRPVQDTRSERFTSRIDAIALHRIFGPLLLLLIFGALFQALFSWSKPIMDAISDGMHWGGLQIAGLLPARFPLLRSLIVDGIVAGVGNVIVFVPQIAVLFFFLGLLEDSGYLARAAFLLDRVLSRVGLHGRAFVPLLSGFACAVPAVLAARTIENRKDRLVTILVTPLMSCSARLPVYGLMIATVFSTLPPILGFIQPGAIVMIAMYVLSITAAMAMAALFKRTILRTKPSPFVLELPHYRRPRLIMLGRHVWSKVMRFLVDAGTVILAITILLWGLFNFPRSAKLDAQHTAARAHIIATVHDLEAQTIQLDAVDGRYAQERLEHSAAGRVGHAIEPYIRPMGWDWKVGVGIIASFAAREVLVSTLGLVYGLGQGADEHSTSLQDAMRKDRDPVSGRPVHTPLSGLSLMVFFVLAMQCMSTLAVVRRETRSLRWPAFQFAYMTVLAVAGALVVYQGGKLLGFG